MERHRKNQIRRRQHVKTCRCCSQLSEGGEAGQIFFELETADQGYDRLLVKDSCPGKVKRIAAGQAWPAEMILAARKWDAAASTGRGGNVGYPGKTVVTKKRQFPTGKLPLAFQAMGREEEFFAGQKKRFQFPDPAEIIYASDGVAGYSSQRINYCIKGRAGTHG